MLAAHSPSADSGAYGQQGLPPTTDVKSVITDAETLQTGMLQKCIVSTPAQVS